MALRLSQKSTSSVPLEVEGILPETVRDKSLDEIRSSEIFQGNTKVALGEFFDVSGDPTDESIDWETAMYYEMEGTRSVRTENWRYVARRCPEGPRELYDMAADSHERFNLFGQPAHANIQKELAVKLDAWFTEFATAEYDIWKGGRSKARRLHAPIDHPDYRPLRSQ